MDYLATAAALSFAVTTLAAAPDATPTDKFEGKVVSAGDGKITIQNVANGENLDFAVDGSTVITRNAKPAQLKEVQVDDKVEITAVTVGDKRIAKTLAALAPE